jgi:hypothetical protein
MEDKRKLTAAIMGAITAYFQMEKSPPATSRVKPETKANAANSPKMGANNEK